MTASSPPDESLLAWTRRIRASDPAALADVFRALHADLERYARSRLHDPDTALDLIQEAFLNLWSRRETLDPDRSLRGYLFTTVRHLALNHNRRHQTHTRLLANLPSPHRVPKPEMTIDADRLGRRIATWIAELPDRQREAFELSRFAGLPLKDIADVMGISRKTAENHVGRALQHLRRRLLAYDPDLLKP